MLAIDALTPSQDSSSPTTQSLLEKITKLQAMRLILFQELSIRRYCDYTNTFLV